MTRPSTTTDGLQAPALAFGDLRVMAVLAALVLFTHAVDGFDNRQLVRLVRAFGAIPTAKLAFIFTEIHIPTPAARPPTIFGNCVARH